MNQNRNEPGVAPGSETPIQSDQPGIETPNPGDQPDNRLELLYGLSETDRAAIMALPETVRGPAIAALHNGRVGYEEAMREQLTTGRQAQDQVDALMAEPTFAAYLRGELVAPGNVPPANPPQQVNTDRNAQYGEPAVAYMNDIAEMVVQKMGGKMDGLQENIQNMQRGFAQTEFEKNWDALVERTGAANLPDPKANESRIRMLMAQNSNMTLDQAYGATLDLSSLPSRTPVEVPDNPPGETTPKTVTEMPGQTNLSAAPRTTLENADPTEVAIQARKDGTNVGPVQGFKNAMLQALKDRNERDGTNLTPEDL